MLLWGMSNTGTCDCGAEQTEDHITIVRRLIYRPPEVIRAIIFLYFNGWAWLKSNSLYKLYVSR